MTELTDEEILKLKAFISHLDDLDYIIKEKDTVESLVRKENALKLLGSLSKAFAGWFVVIGGAIALAYTAAADFINSIVNK